ncbi:chromate transporter, partial [Aureobasidium melanogenum]
MLFTLVAYHAGLICAIFAFLVWSLPGAIGMFLLSIGVGKIKDVLPGPVYGLLSGLNASTVGIIALAAVQLATKAIVDPLSRILVIFGACAGLCYTALWYFPALVGIGGVVAVVWDLYLSRAIGRFRAKRQQRRINQQRVAEESSSTTTTSIPLQDMSSTQASSSRRIAILQEQPTKQLTTNTEASEGIVEEVPASQNHTYTLSLWQSILIFFLFFASFAAVLAARGTLAAPPLILDLFANMYLAGTIIFGGGPVVIPLLREYTVQPGWVSSRDFLIGLAIIQAFPGPNFNFAVYLGALAVSSHAQGLAGAVLGFIGIFLPGLALSTAVSGIWQIVRTKALVVSVLRGINATAVGLVFTAVYRLWEIGYLTPDSGRGKSLANDPWWVVVAAVAYSGTAWFKIPPALAIIAGAVLGLCCRICRESRSVATESGGFVTECDPDQPSDAYWTSSFDFEDAWVDKTHGAPHLNWTSTYEPQFCWAGWPINCMIWESQKFSATPSIMLELIHTRTFGPRPFPLTLPDGRLQCRRKPNEETEFIDANKKLPSWLVVMDVVVVHSDLSSAAATGLFGLLGDAPVQIIPVSEEAKIDSFYDLAERCERGQDVTASQDFTRKSADEMRQELRDEVWLRFKSEDLVAIMHPAIMFRLCPARTGLLHVFLLNLFFEMVSRKKIYVIAAAGSATVARTVAIAGELSNTLSIYDTLQDLRSAVVSVF